MSLQTIDRHGRGHASTSGRYTGHVLIEAEPALFDLDPTPGPEPDPEPLVATAKPLTVKPGKPLVVDAGRGLERFVVLSPTDVNGTRFVVDTDNQPWELSFKDGGCQVVADPELLARRTRIVVEGHRVGISRRVDFARAGLDSAGLTETSSLHLRTCPHLDAPSTTGFQHTTWDRRWAAPADAFVTEAVAAHRADPDSLCECLR